MKNKKNKNKTKRKNKNKLLILFLIIILILLLLLTNLILVARIGNFVPIEKETIFIVTKKPEVVISDKEIEWESNSDINIFSTEYVNENNEIVVQSKEKNNIVAPGTEDSYSFSIKNKGNMAINYKLTIDSKFAINNQNLDINSLPIIIRIKKNNEYCLGTDSKWVPIKELENFVNQGTLGINSYSTYDINWKWEYENSEIDDTKLGILAANSKEPLNFTLKINANAEANNNPKITGGIEYKDNIEIKEVGGTIRRCPFLLLIILIIIIIIILILKTKKYKEEDKKRNKKNGKKNK